MFDSSPCPICRPLRSSRTANAASTSLAAVVPSKSCATSRVAKSYIYHCIAIEPSLSLHCVQSRDSLADIFTEACKVDAFTALRSNLMGNTSYHLTYYPLKRFPHDRGGALEGQPSLLI